MRGSTATQPSVGVKPGRARWRKMALPRPFTIGPRFQAMSSTTPAYWARRLAARLALCPRNRRCHAGSYAAKAGRDDDALAAYRQGIEAAQKKGDRQAEKEMTVFARRLQKKKG